MFLFYNSTRDTLPPLLFIYHLHTKTAVFEQSSFHVNLQQVYSKHYVSMF